MCLCHIHYNKRQVLNEKCLRDLPSAPTCYSNVTTIVFQIYALYLHHGICHPGKVLLGIEGQKPNGPEKYMTLGQQYFQRKI